MYKPSGYLDEEQFLGWFFVVTVADNEYEAETEIFQNRQKILCQFSSGCLNTLLLLYETRCSAE